MNITLSNSQSASVQSEVKMGLAFVSLGFRFVFERVKVRHLSLVVPSGAWTHSHVPCHRPLPSFLSEINLAFICFPLHYF